MANMKHFLHLFYDINEFSKYVALIELAQRYKSVTVRAYLQLEDYLNGLTLHDTNICITYFSACGKIGKNATTKKQESDYAQNAECLAKIRTSG